MEHVSIFIYMVAALVIGGGLYGTTRDSRLRRARLKSLYYDGTLDVFIWTGLDGSTHRSRWDPRRPGGAWYARQYGGPFDGAGYNRATARRFPTQNVDQRYTR